MKTKKRESVSSGCYIARGKVTVSSINEEIAQQYRRPFIGLWEKTLKEFGLSVIAQSHRCTMSWKYHVSEFALQNVSVDQQKKGEYAIIYIVRCTRNWMVGRHIWFLTLPPYHLHLRAILSRSTLPHAWKIPCVAKNWY